MFNRKILSFQLLMLKYLKKLVFGKITFTRQKQRHFFPTKLMPDYNNTSTCYSVHSIYITSIDKPIVRQQSFVELSANTYNYIFDT